MQGQKTCQKTTKMMTASTCIPLMVTINMLAALSKGQYMTSGAISAAYAGHPIAANFESILTQKGLPAPRGFRSPVTPTLAPSWIGLPSSDESLVGNRNEFPISGEMQDYGFWSNYMGGYRPEMVPMMAGSGPVGMYSASVPIPGLSATTLHRKPGKSYPAMYSDFGTAILAKQPVSHSTRMPSLPALGSEALLFETGLPAFGTGIVAHPAAGIFPHPAGGVTGLGTGVAGLRAGMPAFGAGLISHPPIVVARPSGVVSHPTLGSGVASFGMETLELESGVPAFGAGLISRPAAVVTRPNGVVSHPVFGPGVASFGMETAELESGIPAFGTGLISHPAAVVSHPAGIVSHPGFETGVASFDTKAATVGNGAFPFKTNTGSVPASYFGVDLLGGVGS